MVCSKCNTKLPDDAAVCSKCGAEIISDEKKPKGKKEKKSKNQTGAKGRKARIRIILTAACILIVVAAVMTAASVISGNKGMLRAQKLAKKIGETTDKAVSSAKLDFVTYSDYDFLNGLVLSNYISESDKSIDVYDVSMPEWAVFCGEDAFGKLDSVTYCDFRILENNINGIKKKSKIDVSQITTGKTQKEVDSILDMKPYQTVYSKDMVSKKYKYYYRDKQENRIRAYYITVIFDSDENTANSPAIEEENDFIKEILKPEK